MTPEKSLYKINYGSEVWYVIAESLLDAIDAWDLHFGEVRSDTIDESVGMTVICLAICQDKRERVFS